MVAQLGRKVLRHFILFFFVFLLLLNAHISYDTQNSVGPVWTNQPPWLQTKGPDLMTTIEKLLIIKLKRSNRDTWNVKYLSHFGTHN